MNPTEIQMMKDQAAERIRRDAEMRIAQQGNQASSQNIPTDTKPQFPPAVPPVVATPTPAAPPVAPTETVTKEVTKPRSPTYVYYSRTSGGRFIFSDNQEVYFMDGRLYINAEIFPGEFNCAVAPNLPPHPSNGKPRWEVYKNELDAICPPRGNNPNIFRQGELPLQDMSPIGKVDSRGRPMDPRANASAESQVILDAARTAGRNTRTTGDATLPGTGLPTNVEQTTIDPELQRAMFEANNRALGQALADNQAMSPISIG